MPQIELAVGPRQTLPSPLWGRWRLPSVGLCLIEALILAWLPSVLCSNSVAFFTVFFVCLLIFVFVFVPHPPWEWFLNKSPTCRSSPWYISTEPSQSQLARPRASPVGDKRSQYFRASREIAIAEASQAPPCHPGASSGFPKPSQDFLTKRVWAGDFQNLLQSSGQCPF